MIQLKKRQQAKAGGAVATTGDSRVASPSPAHSRSSTPTLVEAPTSPNGSRLRGSNHQAADTLYASRFGGSIQYRKTDTRLAPDLLGLRTETETRTRTGCLRWSESILLHLRTYLPMVLLLYHLRPIHPRGRHLQEYMRLSQ